LKQKKLTKLKLKGICLMLQEQQWGQEQQNNSADYVEQLKLQAGENKVRIVSNYITAYIHFCEMQDGKKKKLTCLGKKNCPVCNALQDQLNPIISKISELTGTEFDAKNLFDIIKDAKKTQNNELIELCDQYNKLNENRGQKKNVAYAIDRKDAKVKILEFGANIKDGIDTLAKDADWGNPNGYDIKITKSGTGRDTKYGTAPGKQSPLTEEETAQVNSMKPLTDLYNPKTVAEVEEYGLKILDNTVVVKEEPVAEVDSEEIPF
jgi:hypothetical protein